MKHRYMAIISYAKFKIHSTQSLKDDDDGDETLF